VLDLVMPAADAFLGEHEWDDKGSDDELPLPQELLCRAQRRSPQDAPR
jgi:hypothetical protein